MKLIGIGGTNGSGKDSLSEILANDYGWLFVSVSRDLIIPELKSRGLPLEREQMAALTAEWNRKIHMGAVIDKALEKFNQENQAHKFGGLVISSLRHPAEADRIHTLGGTVVWVDADPQVRYQRAVSRRQGDKDNKSFQEFMAEERREMTHSGDEATLNWVGVKAKADVFLANDTNDIENLKTAAREALGL